MIIFKDYFGSETLSFSYCKYFFKFIIRSTFKCNYITKFEFSCLGICLVFLVCIIIANYPKEGKLDEDI